MKSIYAERRKTLADAVLADHTRLDMTTWFLMKERRKGSKGRWLFEAPTKRKFDSCGTSACLAGTALLVFPDLRKQVVRGKGEGSSEEKVAEYLGISVPGFYSSAWPNKFYDAYLKTKKGTLKSAKIAIQAMKHYIVKE